MKGVEIGDGFMACELRGSQNRDEITKDGFRATMGRHSRRYQQRAANHCPYGAESNVQHYRAGRTINRFGEEVEMITKGRHDPCVGIRADR